MNDGENKRTGGALALLVASMCAFGTIGLFRRLIPLPSGTIAFFRGLIGTLTLAFVMLVMKKRPDVAAIKRNLVLLLVSGAAIGFNWIWLFEAFNHTSVATATLCYYMAPMIVVMLSPFLLREKMTIKRMCCVVVTLVGAVLVSGVLNGGDVGLRGMLLGFGAALLYASVILMNKFLKEIGAYDKTIIQLGAAAVVMLPYTLLAERVTVADFTPTAILLLLVVGVFHTGISYAMYFGSVGMLPAQTVAIFSYIDPALAVILSALVLQEPIGAPEIVGAILILGSAIAGEITLKKQKKADK